MDRLIVAHARAKVNLHLDVLSRRPDGYHEIETIYQSVDLYDRLEIKLDPGGRVTIACSDPEIPRDSNNLCARALAELSRLVGQAIGARIRIEKNIPAGAGLGGGSSDAAAVLLAANQLAGLGLSMEELSAAGLRTGSDVPFMLRGGTMLGRGRGEDLTPLEQVRRGWFLIVKPPIDIATTWAYEHFNFALTKHRHRVNLKAINAILARFPEVKPSFRNALEDVVCPAYPAISGMLEKLLSSEPLFASMSGSGSAAFAVYRSEAKASLVAEKFAVEGFFAAVVRPAEKAVELFPR